jgi:hypothetical protein
MHSWFDPLQAIDVEQSPDGISCCPAVSLLLCDVIAASDCIADRGGCLAAIMVRRYFAPAAQKPRGALMRSLRHALGPNFGSLCLAAWLLNLLQVGRDAGQAVRAGVVCSSLLPARGRCCTCVWLHVLLVCGPQTLCFKADVASIAVVLVVTLLSSAPLLCCCLLVLLLLLPQMLKSMAENARAENRDNFFVQLLVSCFEFLLTVRERQPSADSSRG